MTSSLPFLILKSRPYAKTPCKTCHAACTSVESRRFSRLLLSTALMRASNFLVSLGSVSTVSETVESLGCRVACGSEIEGQPAKKRIAAANHHSERTGKKAGSGPWACERVPRDRWLKAGDGIEKTNNFGANLCSNGKDAGRT